MISIPNISIIEANYSLQNGPDIIQHKLHFTAGEDARNLSIGDTLEVTIFNTTNYFAITQLSWEINMSGIRIVCVTASSISYSEDDFDD